MSSVQERLQLKRVPLDKWSVREQLCLASAVECSGDQNWMSVSRALKMLAVGGGANRPSDWYSQKFCAAQYGKLLENVETPKRKKRTDKEAGGAWNTVETPGESILRKLTHERMSELNRQMGEQQREHARIKEEIALVQSTNDEAELRRIWQQIEAEQRQQEKEASQQAQWLKEREARKLELERAWRPSTAASNMYSNKVTAVANTAAASAAAASAAAASTSTATPPPKTPVPNKPPASTSTSRAASSSVDIIVVEDMDIDETITNKSGTSPLLTSLLKSSTSTTTTTTPATTTTTPSTSGPSVGVPTIIAAAAAIPSPILTSSRVAPTITNLLTGSKPPKAGTPPPKIIISSNAGSEAMFAQSLTGPAPLPTIVQTPPVQSPSQAAPTLSMLLENKSKEQQQQQQPQHSTPVKSSTNKPMVHSTPTPLPPAPLPAAIAGVQPSNDDSILVPDSPIKDDDDLLMEEFNGLIPDNIDELADILTENNAIMLNADQLLDEAADSILDSVESLMAGEEAAAESAVVNTATAVTAPAAPATVIVDDDDDDDDVQMVADLGDANEPIIDVAAAAAAAALGGNEVMTTAELVEQLTSSEPSSAMATGFPLTVASSPVATAKAGREKVGAEAATVAEDAEDDDDDDVVLIDAAVKAMEEVEQKTAAEEAKVTNEPTSNSAVKENAGRVKPETVPVFSGESQPKTSSESAVSPKDDEQSNSSNDAPLSELLKEKLAKSETEDAAATVVVVEDTNEDDGSADSPKGSVRTDVFESDSNDDKCLEIIKREIHELTGLKENESSENSNESVARDTSKSTKQEDADRSLSDIKDVLEANSEEVIDLKSRRTDDMDEEMRLHDGVSETIEAITDEIEKTEQKSDAPAAASSPTIVAKESAQTSDDEEQQGPPLADDDADAEADDDDDDDGDFHDAKDVLLSEQPSSPLKPAIVVAAADVPIQIDDTEDEDIPAEPPTRPGGRLSATRAAAKRDTPTQRGRRDASSQDPGTPQPPSDSDSTASHRSTLTTRRRLRDRDRDRDRSESPYIVDVDQIGGISGSGSNVLGTPIGGGVIDLDAERSSRSRRRYSSTPVIDSMPNSPASTGGGADNGPAAAAETRDQRAWRKSIHLVLGRLAQHRHAGMFQRCVGEEQTPGYRRAVLRPMDLQTLRRNVDAGVVRTTADFQRDVMLMCSNARMWNGGGGGGRGVAARVAEMEADALHSIETIMEAWRKEHGGGSGGGGAGGTLAASPASSTASSSGNATTAAALGLSSKAVRGRKSHRLPPAS